MSSCKSRTLLQKAIGSSHGLLASTGRPSVVVAAAALAVSTNTQTVLIQNQQRRHLAGDSAQPMKKQSPAQKKKAAANAQQQDQGAESLENKRYNMILGALDAPVTKPPPASPEEMERRHQVGRNYVIGQFERHNEMQHDLACKIKLKNHAIKMLPKGTKLRAEALEEDDEGPPAWRHIPVWTPPIPGFDPDEFMEQDEK